MKPDEQKATLDPLSAVIFITSGVAASADNPCAWSRQCSTAAAATTSN